MDDTNSIDAEIAACQSARKAVIGDRTSCSVSELESIHTLVKAQRGPGDGNMKALRELVFKDLITNLSLHSIDDWLDTMESQSDE